MVLLGDERRSSGIFDCQYERFSSSRSKLLYAPPISICIIGSLMSHGLFKENLVDVLWGFGPDTYGLMEHVHGGAFIIGIIFGLLIITKRLYKT